MTPLDRPGRFKLRPLSVRPVEGKSFVAPGSTTETKSFNVAITFFVLHEFSKEGEWLDWTQFERTVEGFFNIVGKDGLVGPSQERNARDLVQHLGWSGDIMDILEPERFLETAKDCCAVIEWNEYEGKRTLRVAWLTDDKFSGPGVSDDRKQAIANQHGSTFRALAGNVKRNAVPQPPPVMRPQPVPSPPQATGVPANASAEPVPF